MCIDPTGVMFERGSVRVPLEGDEPFRRRAWETIQTGVDLLVDAITMYVEDLDR